MSSAKNLQAEADTLRKQLAARDSAPICKCKRPRSDNAQRVNIPVLRRGQVPTIRQSPVRALSGATFNLAWSVRCRACCPGYDCAPSDAVPEGLQHRIYSILSQSNRELGHVHQPEFSRVQLLAANHYAEQEQADTVEQYR